MKNLLVEYKGGGFDGCFWQWNYFGWDDMGKFHNILSNGYKGVKDEMQALHKIDAYADHLKCVRSGDNEYPYRHYDDSRTTVINLNRPDSLLQFVDNGNASLMYHIANFNDYFGEKLQATCHHCGAVHNVVDMFPGDESGDGGLAISSKNLYCADCYYSVQSVYATLIFENAKLTIGEFSHYQGNRSHYDYALFIDDKLIFSGNDYSPSPMSGPYSLDSLLGLLSFLTVKPGDTDDEYFEKYTQDQLDFTDSQICEDLSLLGYDSDNGEFEDNWTIDTDYDEYDSPIFTVGYNQ